MCVCVWCTFWWLFTSWKMVASGTCYWYFVYTHCVVGNVNWFCIYMLPGWAYLFRHRLVFIKSSFWKKKRIAIQLWHGRWGECDSKTKWTKEILNRTKNNEWNTREKQIPPMWQEVNITLIHNWITHCYRPGMVNLPAAHPGL